MSFPNESKIRFIHNDTNYKINLVKEGKSSHSVKINGVTYGVLGDKEKLNKACELLNSVSLDSILTEQDLRERLQERKDISFPVKKTEALGIKILKVESPAGQKFSEWLDVFNRGNEQEFKEFEKNFSPKLNPAELSKFLFEVIRKDTGGFDFKLIEESNSTQLSVWVQERGGLEMYPCIKLEVEPNEPHLITQLSILPPEAKIPEHVSRMAENEVLEVTNQHIDELIKNNQFSGTVILTKNGKQLLARAAGLADIEGKRENTLDTKFNIASMGKMFTTVAILQLLQQENKLDLEAPLGKYLKEPKYNLHPKLADVKIKHLLTHTGGTGSLKGPEFKNLSSVQDFVNAAGKRDLEFEAGKRWNYSNFGFILLGAIIEEVSGKDYYQYVQENIFDTSGMKDTGSFLKTDDVPNKAVGYLKKEGQYQKNDDALLLRGTPAGGSYSTAKDMQLFANSLLNNKMLNKETLQKATTSQKVSEDGSTYCYGFMNGYDLNEKEEKTVPWFGHEGHEEGGTAELRIYPETGYVISVMSNHSSGACELAEFIGARLPG